MAKICPLTKETVLYLDCLDCDEECIYSNKKTKKKIIKIKNLKSSKNKEE